MTLLEWVMLSFMALLLWSVCSDWRKTHPKKQKDLPEKHEDVPETDDLNDAFRETFPKVVRAKRDAKAKPLKGTVKP